MTATGRSGVLCGSQPATWKRTAVPAVALLASALLNFSCSDSGAGAPPPAATQPAAETAGDTPAADEDLPALVRFWVTTPRLDPGAEGWRLRGEPAARLALATYQDIALDAVLRQQAVVALGHFDLPWVGEELRGILADRDKPDAVRIAAARSLVEHALLTGGEAAAVQSLGAIVSSPAESVHLRGAVGQAVALLPLPQARAILEHALEGELPEGLADRLGAALGVHDLELETRRLAALLEVKVGSTVAEFVPVPEAQQKIGVPGPDVRGEWRPATVIVSAMSRMPDPVRIRIDFDPLERGLLFADEAPVGGSARYEALQLEPGQRRSTTRRVDMRALDVASEVWIFVDGHAPPVFRLPVRLQAEPAVK